MDCKGILLLAFLGLLDLTPGRFITAYKEEISFNKTLEVHNRTVSCSGELSGSKYEFSIYTCSNISIDGWPVFHGNNDYKEDPAIFNNNGCPGCPCGVYENEPNDVFALCAAMLKAQGVEKPVLAAYAPKPVCKQTKKEPRIKFFMSENKHHWLQVKANNGHLSQLQCMLAKDN